MTFIIVLPGMQTLCQVNNDIDKPGINWHHMDIALDNIPGISTDRAYNEVLKKRKATKIIVAILDDGGECSTWINVGATSRKPDSALTGYFSNYGKKSVDIMAPGVKVTSLFPDNETFLTEGTSIAAPMVSGVAALVWSYFPELSAIEVKSILLESAEYFGDHKVLLPGTSDKKILFKELSKTGGIIKCI